MINDSEGSRLSSMFKRVSTLIEPRGGSQDELKKFWMPDSNCKECYECGGHFTTFRRRHHCRICGQIFCSKCCHQEIPGKKFGLTGSLRACHYCCSYLTKHTNLTSKKLPSLNQLNKLEKSKSISYDDFTYEHNAKLSINGMPLINPAQKDSVNAEANLYYSETDTKSLSNDFSLNEADYYTDKSLDLFYDQDATDITSREVNVPNYSSLPNSYNLEALGLGAYLSSVYEKMQHPLLGIKLANNRLHFKNYPNTITGAQVIEWILRLPSIANREAASSLAQALLDFDYITSVTNGKTNKEAKPAFRDNDIYKAGLASVTGINKLSLPDPTSECEYTKVLNMTLAGASSVSYTTRSQSPEVGLKNIATVADIKEEYLYGNLAQTADSIKIDINPKKEDNFSIYENTNLAGDEKDMINKCIDEILVKLIKTSINANDNFCEQLSPSLLSHLRNLVRQRLWFEKITDEQHMLKWESTIVEMALRVIDFIELRPTGNPEFDNICSCIKIKKISPSYLYFLHDAELMEKKEERAIFLFPGIVFTQNLVHKDMTMFSAKPKLMSIASQHNLLLELRQPSILMLRGPIEYQRVEHKLASLEPIIMQEREYLKNVVAKITALKPDIVIVLKQVCLLARELMLEAGIALIHNVKKEQLFTQLSILVEAEVVRSMEGGHLFFKPKMGLCRSLKIVKVYSLGSKSKTLVFVEAYSASDQYISKPERLPYCTLLLSTSRNLRIAGIIKRILRFTIYAAYHLKLDASFGVSCQVKNETITKELSYSEWTKAFRTLMQLKNFLFYPEKVADATLIENDVKHLSPSGETPDACVNKVALYQLLLLNISLSVTPDVRFKIPYMDCLKELTSNPFRGADDNAKMKHYAYLSNMIPSRLYFSKFWDNTPGEILLPPNCDSNEKNDVPITNISETKDGLLFRHFVESSDDLGDYLARFRYEDEYMVTPNKETEVIDENHNLLQNSPPDCFDITSLQRIHFLFYSFSTNSTNYPSYCISPWIVKMNFYGLHDISLHTFLFRFCFDPNYQCPSSVCQASCLTHVRRFVHDNRSINITLLNYASDGVKNKQFFSADVIIYWTGCKKCGVPLTGPSCMSRYAKQLSFGKYLESLAYGRTNDGNTCKTSQCSDASIEARATNLNHFFAYRSVVACFTCQNVKIGNIVFPPSQINFYQNLSSEFRRTCLNDVECLTVLGYNVFNSINERILLYGTEILNQSSSPLEQDKINEMCSTLERDRTAFKELLEGSQIMLTKVPRAQLMNGSKPDSQLCLEIDENMYVIENLLCEAKSLLVRCIYSWNPRLSDMFNMWKSEKSGKNMGNTSLDKDIEKGKMRESKFKQTDIAESCLNNTASNIATISSQVQDNKRSQEGKLDEMFSVGKKLDATICDVEQDNLETNNLGDSKKDVTFTFNIKNKLSALISSSSFDPIPTPFSPFEHYNLPFNANDHLRTMVSEEMPSSIIAFALSTMEYEIRLKEIKRFSGTLIEPSIPKTNSHLIQPQQTQVFGEMDNNLQFKLNENTGSTKNSNNISYIPTLQDKEKDSRESQQRSQHIEINFQDDTTSAKFYCKIYFANEFSRLRALLFPKGDIQYARSLSRSIKWFTGGGKSGSSFCKTSDGRFLIKQMSRLELQSFLNFAIPYVAYLKNSMRTSAINKKEESGCLVNTIALAKIVGAYKVSFKNLVNNTSVKQDYIVMENLFYGKRSIKRVFDLKGSVRNRLVNVDLLTPSTNESETFDKTTNRVNLQDQASSFGTSEPNTFLESETKRAAEPECQIPLNNFDTSDYTKDERKPQIPNVVLLDENFIRMTLETPLYIYPFSKMVIINTLERDTQFLADHEIMDYSLLVAWDADSDEYSIGIIDYIRSFTWDKRLEMVVKKSGLLGGQGKTPTIISPQMYRARFIDAMKRYFLATPDHWYNLATIPNI